MSSFPSSVLSQHSLGGGDAVLPPRRLLSSVLSQHSLGGGNRALPPRVHLTGLPQSAGERLERRLHNVVAVGASQLPDVKRHARRVCKRLEKVLHQLRLVRADSLRGEVQVTAEVGPP